jgi:hypothetical protein
MSKAVPSRPRPETREIRKTLALWLAGPAALRVAGARTSGAGRADDREQLPEGGPVRWLTGTTTATSFKGPRLARRER